MRPGQQNRRMRGRGNNPNSNSNSNNNNSNNQRRGPNPLTRNYESNGPDVKIRGSAQQIAEKYGNLARDSHSSGDRVMAENYLQHAEHYNRIIAAAQAQMPVQQQGDNRDNMDDGDDERDEFDSPSGGSQAPRPSNDGSGPQPVIEGMPAEAALEQDVLAREERSREGGPNGSFANGGHPDENVPHRGRRPRRGGRGRDDEAGEVQGAAGGEGEVENAPDTKDEIILPVV